MKRTLLITSAVLLLAACSKSDPQENTLSGVKPISATSAIEGTSTRAITGTDAALAAVTFVRLDDASTNKTADFDFSASAAISGSRAAGGAITFDPEQLYDQQDKTAYIVGCHPAGTLASGVVSWTPDGATDILMSDVWNAGRYSSPVTTGMTFRHILARIEVICQGESGSALSAVQSVWGDITAIKFAGALPAMTYTYATNTVAANGTPADFTLLNGATYTTGAFTPVAIPANANSAVTASAMLPPVASADITLKVTTAKKEEKSVPITLSGNFAKGGTHKITLDFKADGKNIEAKASTIVDWTTGVTGSGDVTE